MTSIRFADDNRLGWALCAAAGLVIYIAFTIWGGIPRGDLAGAFWAQIGLLLLILCGFALAAWHLLLRPLPPGRQLPKPDRLSPRLCHGIALAQTSGMAAIIISAIWDELWHRKYGIPFGEDFFWPPHLLMYFGFIIIIGVGMWALRYLNRHLRGSFQQRFRANKAIGLFILNAAFLIYALAADPVWHSTFGQDLTAWSVPHLILLTSVILTLMVTLYVYFGGLPAPTRRGIADFKSVDALPILVFALCLLVWLQIMLIDWDATLSGIQPAWLGLYRPQWLLAGCLVACVTFTGIVATRKLGIVGVATAAGLLALALRYSMIQLFETDLLQYVAWIAALLPLLAIDLWTWYCLSIRKRATEWRGTALAVILAMLPNLLVIRSLYNLGDADNLACLLAIAVSALGMSWFSHQVATAMRHRQEDSPEIQSAQARISPRLSISYLGGFSIFMLFVMLTAAPPV